MLPKCIKFSIHIFALPSHAQSILCCLEVSYFARLSCDFYCRNQQLASKLDGCAKKTDEKSTPVIYVELHVIDNSVSGKNYKQILVGISEWRVSCNTHNHNK